MIMVEFSLNGQWQLFRCPLEIPEIKSPQELKNSGIAPIPAAVPGDIELDCAAAGIMPEDPFWAMNPEAFRKLEESDWFYCREFELPDSFQPPFELVADGIDCCAEIFIDGKKIGESANALIPHRFPLDISGGKHEIAVRIRSAKIEAKKYPAEAGEWPQNDSVFNRMTLRKCAHSWGWDITPRFICGGIFRDIKIESIPEYRIDPVFVRTDPGSTVERSYLHIYYHFHEPERTCRAAAIRFRGECKDSSFVKLLPVESVSGYISVGIVNPYCWFPNGYGAADLYQLRTELLDHDGNILAARDDRFGIRTLTFDRSNYRFTVNGVPIRCRGVNWSPADAMHSRIEERLQKLMPEITELGCNIVRCWGGGVYESETFFNFCDENGIMVWQDFAMACALYPQSGEFVEALQKEAEVVISRLRHHPSLAIWCGDNECDQFYVELFRSPDDNILTRQLLPQCLRALDPDRPYVPSSPAVVGAGIYPGMPFFDPETVFAQLPERHLWGARVNFRKSYYNPEKATFIGETGWHGAPAMESLKKFLSPSACRVDFDNVQWIMHGSDAFRWGGGFTARPHIMRRQLQDYFGMVPNDLETFVFASQVFQVEALRYVVQQARLKPEMNGFIWWNLADCWPCFSEAIIDYFGVRKPAFFMLRELFKPVAVMLPDDGVKVVNDTDGEVSGVLRWQIAGEDTWHEENFSAAPGISSLDIALPEAELLLVSWHTSAGDGVNHRIKDLPQADLDIFLRHREKLLEFSGC